MGNERPILFSGAMVRAILAGTKRQTRRVVKLPGHTMEERDDGTLWPHCSTWSHGDDGTPWATCPYGAPGDRLYVRESVRRAPLPNILTGEPTNALCIQYVADGGFACDAHGFDYAWRWKRGTLPSIHLPRDCSRITLVVGSVRVERLHDITEEDAKAEGVTSPDVEQSPCLKCGGAGPFSCVCRGTGHYLDSAICPQCLGERLCVALGAGLGAMEVDCTDCDTYRKRFRNLWNHINGAESWSENPWVWVVGFSPVTR